MLFELLQKAWHFHGGIYSGRMGFHGDFEWKLLFKNLCWLMIVWDFTHEHMGILVNIPDK